MWTKTSDRSDKLVAFHAGWSNWVWGNGPLKASVLKSKELGSITNNQ